MLLATPDEKLIDKALSGSQGSWVKLVKRYEGLVYNHALRMTGNPSDAMDLMQEVFLSVYRHLPSYRRDGPFKAWMMRIAANKSLDFLRAGTRAAQVFRGQEEDGEQWDGPGGEEHEPALAYQRFADNRDILRLLASLPADQRLAVEMKFFQHLTFEEIGGQSGVSVNTVKSRLYAALRKLKDQLEQQDAM